MKVNCSIIGTDDLRFGNTLIYNNQAICAADYLHVTDQGMPFDGILGLSPSGNEKDKVDVVSNFMSSARKVSFWFNRNLLPNMNVDDVVDIGDVIFGDVTAYTNHYRFLLATIPIYKVEGQKIQAWTIKLNSILIEGQSIINIDGPVILDTGYPFASLPELVWNSMYLGFAPQKGNFDRYYIDCKKVNLLPAMTMNFDGNLIVINGRQQVLVTAGCKCELVFTKNKYLLDWEKQLWGVSFLSNFFTSFDLGGSKVMFYSTTHDQFDTATCLG
jgi:hypothetical protein